MEKDAIVVQRSPKEDGKETKHSEKRGLGRREVQKPKVNKCTTHGPSVVCSASEISCGFSNDTKHQT